jgi:hypothetical protein
VETRINYAGQSAGPSGPRVVQVATSRKPLKIQVRSKWSRWSKFFRILPIYRAFDPLIRKCIHRKYYLIRISIFTWTTWTTWTRPILERRSAGPSKGSGPSRAWTTESRVNSRARGWKGRCGGPLSPGSSRHSREAIFSVDNLVDHPGHPDHSDHFHGPASGCLTRRSDAPLSRLPQKDVPSGGWHERTQKRGSSGLSNQRSQGGNRPVAKEF